MVQDIADENAFLLRTNHGMALHKCGIDHPLKNPKLHKLKILWCAKTQARTLTPEGVNANESYGVLIVADGIRRLRFVL